MGPMINDMSGDSHASQAENRDPKAIDTFPAGAPLTKGIDMGLQD